MQLRWLGLASAALLAGCAAKETFPVALSQPDDDSLTCAQINEQAAYNTAAARDFLHSQHQTNVTNVVGTVVIGALGAGLADFSEGDRIRARSMIDRNEKLQYLAKKRGCS